MAFILWRRGTDGVVEYVTDWAGDGAAYSSDRENALEYATRAAAESAMARRTAARWQIEEIGED